MTTESQQAIEGGPSDDELFEALAPWRVDAEEFEQAVQERASEMEAGSTDAQSTEAPRWIRRAAAIAPAALWKSALVLKTGKGAASGGGLAAMGMATPLALLAVGVLGIFASTFRLRADRVAGKDGHKTERLQRVLMTGAILIPYAAFILLLPFMFRATHLMGPFIGGLIVVATGVVIRTMSALGIATRPLLTKVLSVMALEIALYGLMVSWVSIPNLVAVAVLCAFGVSLQKQAQRWNGKDGNLELFASLATLVPICAVGLHWVARTGPEPFGDRPSEIIEWANRVDASADDLSLWATLGWIPSSLDAKDVASLDRDRLRTAALTITPAMLEKRRERRAETDQRLAKRRIVLRRSRNDKQQELARESRPGTFLHPVSRQGMFALELFDDETLPDVERERYGKPLFAPRNKYYPGDLRSDLRVARASGAFDAEAASALRARLNEAWPAEGEDQVLERAAELLRVAQDAGLTPFVREKLNDVPSMVRAASITTGKDRDRGGFRSRADRAGDEDGLDTLHSSATLAATWLMAEWCDATGSSAAALDVDRLRLARALDKRRHRLKTTRAQTFQVEAALARHILEARLGPIPEDQELWIQRWGLLAGVLLSILMGQAAVSRTCVPKERT